MPLPPESLEASKCYLTEAGQVRRIIRLMSDGRVQFEIRGPLPRGGYHWLARIQDRRSLAAILDREVACGWTGDD